MSAIGINAGNLSLQTLMFSSVSVTQVSVTSDVSFDKLMTEKSADTGQQLRTDSSSEPKADASQKAEMSDRQNTSVDDSKRKTDVSEKTKVAGSDTDSVTDAAETITDEELEEASAVIMTVIEQISVVLQITVGELEESMKDLGISATDLFDKNSLAQLVLYQNNATDSTEFLVNPELLELYNKVREIVDEALDSMQLEPEKLFEALENYDLSELKQLLQNSKTDSGEETGDVQNDSSVNTEESAEPIFTVERHDDTAKSQEQSTSDSEEGFEGVDREETPRDVHGKTDSHDGGLNAFLDRLEGAAGTTDVPMTEELGEVSVRDIVYQLVDAIKVDIGPENTSLTMHLSPESLGRVSLNISSKDGVMTAHITTENQTAREAIESQLQILKENIQSRGITVEAIEVTVSSFDFSDSRYAENKENGREEGRRSTRHGIEISDTSDVAALEAEAQRIEQEIMQENGSTINYVA